ncbi:MAG TPA: hypothetical protein DCZ05_08150 [Deltaproteobacteria bacterium]|nr:hypothetical protein [Deltaproteobacteria bacterium]
MCTDLTYLPEVFAQHLGKEGNKLSVLPYLMQNTILSTGRFIYQPLYTKKPWDPLNFIVIRNAYSLYFGTFSNAVWRISEKPQFLLKETFEAPPNLISFDELLARGWGLSDMVKLYDLPSVSVLYQRAL